MALTKEDLQAIKGIVVESVSGLETRMTGVEDSLTKVEDGMTKVEDRLTKVEDGLAEVKVVMLENSLIPKVDEIAAYQKSVYERYTMDADRFEQKIATIDLLENTITDHSKQIQELQLKQA